MNNLKNMLVQFHNNEEGVSSTEYMIMLILLACAIIAIVTTYGKTIKQKFTDANNTVSSSVVISNN